VIANLKKVSKKYSSYVIKDLTLEIEDRITGLIGPMGQERVH
jgi:ABC-type enterochelin transport system ATPase subunit